MLKTCAVALASAAALLAAPPALAEPLSFTGEVARGAAFVRPVPSGSASLEFRLLPIAHGWQIWVGDPARPKDNFVALATPPFRGINPAIIEGWHFRNADNSGPNQPGPGNVNAPQRDRAFAFMTDAADYQSAAQSLDIVLWPYRHDPIAIAAAQDRLTQLPKGHGTLHIDEMTLGNLTPGAQAWIERMAFTVTLQPPDKM